MKTRPSDVKMTGELILGDVKIWVTGMTNVDVNNWQINGCKTFVFLLFQSELKIVNRSYPRVTNFYSSHLNAMNLFWFETLFLLEFPFLTHIDMTMT